MEARRVMRTGDDRVRHRPLHGLDRDDRVRTRGELRMHPGVLGVAAVNVQLVKLVIRAVEMPVRVAEVREFDREMAGAVDAQHATVRDAEAAAREHREDDGEDGARAVCQDAIQGRTALANAISGADSGQSPVASAPRRDDRGA